MGRATPRAYGGAGMLLGGPPLEIDAHPANQRSFLGLSDLDQAAQQEVASAISRMEASIGIPVNLRFTLRGNLRQHVGLGTKTALLLAVLQAASIATGADLDVAELQALSGRGGASGIGINAFFDGGFLLDGGHRQDDVASLLPSSQREPRRVPPVLARLDVPEDWRFRLLLPAGHRIAGKTEVSFFERNIPIPADEVRQTISLLLQSVAPAVATRDLQTLREGLVGLHKCGFKRREIDAQSAEVRKLLAAAQKIAPAGLSSMGPLIYVVYHRDNKPPQLDQLAMRNGLTDLGVWPGRSSGFEYV